MRQIRLQQSAKRHSDSVSKSRGNSAEYQDVLGVRFHQLDLLTQALTHRSYVNEYGYEDDSMRDNERLEFLGDAVMDIIVADMLYQKYPDVSEGDLTQLRAALVRTESLASIAGEFRLGEYLRIGHGEELNGGRQRATILCRAFEAVIGAMYLDQGMGSVEAFVMPSLLRMLDHVIENDLHLDARSQLQERVQGRLQITPCYRLASADGPDHAREFRVEVTIGESIIGTGIGASKRAAAQDAARVALLQLETEGLPDSLEIAEASD